MPDFLIDDSFDHELREFHELSKLKIISNNSISLIRVISGSLLFSQFLA